MRRKRMIRIQRWDQNSEFRTHSCSKFIRLPIVPLLRNRKLSPKEVEEIKDFLTKPVLTVLKTTIRIENIIRWSIGESEKFLLLDLILLGEKNFVSLKNSGSVSDKKMRLALQRQLDLDFFESLPQNKKRIVREVQKFLKNKK